MKTATITALIAVSFLVFKRLKQNKTYKIIKHHSNDPKLLSIIQKINIQNIKVPKQPNKIQPPKPVFKRYTVQYADDENDFISYDLLTDESCCKNPVIILCFMGGHSKSACIRRLANAFYENKHPVYVLLQRSTLDIKINPNVKKFRAFRSSITDDIDMLLGIIPEKKVILAGYSLGGFAAAHYMTDFDIECKNRDKVEKIIVGYVELDLSYNVVMPMRVQKHVGQVIVPVHRRKQRAVQQKRVRQHVLGRYHQTPDNPVLRRKDMVQVLQSDNGIVLQVGSSTNQTARHHGTNFVHQHL
ncbi:Alpha/beta_hydrolase family protein [Hexamita inflata]|uniref:Alpha/beta_hydrolase family protein n=1 Tax=Hexamita inflata TaxID=28002 RepID=A0ABP1LLM6_9EUKA